MSKRLEINSDRLLKAVSADSEMYINWLNEFDKTPDSEYILTGPEKSHAYPVWPRNHDNFHFPVGMSFLLSNGFTGIRDQARSNAEKVSGNKAKYLEAIAGIYDGLIQTIDAFAIFAKEAGQSEKYRICKSLTNRNPESFIEACQLYWFATIFRINTSTIGRIDQHLYTFYSEDIKNSRITEDDARQLIKELLGRFEKRGDYEGDTLQNITLSGRNSANEDLTNDLTYFILEEFIDTSYIEPKINVRIHGASPERLKKLIAELQMNGSGNCTIFNDDAIIPGLLSYGRPEAVADNYCADGCSEIILDGHGETAFRYIDCVKAVEHVLFNGENRKKANKRIQYYSQKKEMVDVQCPVPEGTRTGDFLSMDTYEQFLSAYYEQIKYQIDIILTTPYNKDDSAIRLFTAATFPGVIDSGIDPFSNPECYHTYGIFIGSLGAAANSLMAVKKIIYEEKTATKKELLDALDSDFLNFDALRKKCFDVPKFGNDEDEVDQIASDVAETFARFVEPYSDRLGRPVLPGLYNHLFHHTALNVGATPDGRIHGDPVGEHLSPTPGTAKNGPSAVINSVVKINTSKQIFGSTLHLNIPRLSLNGHEKGVEILMALNDVFCLKSGCVMNVNVLNADILRKAQEMPDLFQDLVVRVWGFSYYFCQLSKEMQEHVIARAESA